MAFADVLREVARRVEGCVGLMVMGGDGIPIEKLWLDQKFNLELLATECTSILRDTRQAAEDVGAGRLREMVVSTEALTVVAVAITEDYFLLGALRSGAGYGKARFAMKRASVLLEKEFA